MTWTVWAAIVIVILTVAALIKRYETRLVLLASGFLMTCLSLDPMQGLNAFAKSMTNSGLIMAICSAMGFAFFWRQLNRLVGRRMPELSRSALMRLWEDRKTLSKKANRGLWKKVSTRNSSRECTATRVLSRN